MRLRSRRIGTSGTSFALTAKPDRISTPARQIAAPRPAILHARPTLSSPDRTLPRAVAARRAGRRGRRAARPAAVGLTTHEAVMKSEGKLKALAVLSSDALSSVAYATEEILHVLLLAGLAALSLSLPIGAAIVAARREIRPHPPSVDRDRVMETPTMNRK